MKKYAIIVAGGSGNRMNSATPKQFMDLCKEPLLFHTIRKFYSFDEQTDIIVALPEKDISFWEQLCSTKSFTIPHRVVKGGETRFNSVKNALSQIGEKGIIAVHDGVRPLVSIETIERCYAAAEKYGNAIPVLDVVDSLRKVHNEENHPVDRNKFKLVQTPQVFCSDIIIDAYQQDFSDNFTDDASVIENRGISIKLVEGNRENIKITTPFDMAIAESYINSRK